VKGWITVEMGLCCEKGTVGSPLLKGFTGGIVDGGGKRGGQVILRRVLEEGKTGLVK